MKSEFGRALEDLDIRLPNGIELREVVAYGWLSPVLRVALPSVFFDSWQRYPTLWDELELEEDDVWAANLYLRAVTHWPPPDDDVPGRHFLETDTKPGPEARKRAIACGPRATDPEPIEHVHTKQVIYPWIDYFRYWHAYELADVLPHTTLIAPPRNTPHVRDSVEKLREHLDKCVALSTQMVEVVRRRWRDREGAFERLSQTKTVLAVWARRERSRDSLEGKVHEFLDRSGLTPETIQRDVRDVLLPLSEEWKNSSQISPATKASLQQDLSLALDVWGIATGKEVDFEDPLWSSESGMIDTYPRLLKILPDELANARYEFPHYASNYLAELNGRLPESNQLTTSAIRKLLIAWWPHSAPLRRFCLSFFRLHRHYSRNRFNESPRELLTTHTPIDFLLLSALFVEKMLAGMYRIRSPQATKAQEFNDLVKDSANVVIAPLGIKDRARFMMVLKRLMKCTGLHRLQSRAPSQLFLSDKHVKYGDPLAQIVLRSLGNFARLRNYAAHHDCLDFDLIYGPCARPAMEAMLVVALAMLKASTPPNASSNRS